MLIFQGGTMARTAVITDTDASLPLELADEYGIMQVPITIHFGDQVLQACHEIDDRELFLRVDQDSKVPTTAAPSPGDFARAYRQAAETGADQVLCFTVSSQVSATYQSALTARELVPELTVEVVDTWSVSMGQGFLVLEAAEMIRHGLSVQEILEQMEEIRSRTHLFAALDTLRYMAMSGRVGHLTAGMANVLDIKPILTIRNGKLDLLEKVRTRRKSRARLIDLIQNSLTGKEIKRIFLIHVDALERAEAFEVQLRKALGYRGPMPYTELTPGLSVHAGKGVVGAAYLTD
jgi:DegV family protein with EDD domain